MLEGGPLFSLTFRHICWSYPGAYAPPPNSTSTIGPPGLDCAIYTPIGRAPEHRDSDLGGEWLSYNLGLTNNPSISVANLCMMNNLSPSLSNLPLDKPLSGQTPERREHPPPTDDSDLLEEPWTTYIPPYFQLPLTLCLIEGNS